MAAGPLSPSRTHGCTSLTCADVRIRGLACLTGFPLFPVSSRRYPLSGSTGRAQGTAHRNNGKGQVTFRPGASTVHAGAASAK